MFQSVVILALISAFFYCVAMIAMKSLAELPTVVLALIIGATLYHTIGRLTLVAALPPEQSQRSRKLLDAFIAHQCSIVGV